MPIYEYRCTQCEHEFEEMMQMGAAPPPCPKCAAAVERMLSAMYKVTKRKVGTKARTMDKLIREANAKEKK